MSCANCERPICTDCMVYTSVGIKCPECARQPRSAIVRLRPDKRPEEADTLETVAGIYERIAAR